MGRFGRVMRWGVHATTVFLGLLMVFSYLPNGWVGRYKHETGILVDGVAGQYIVWSGRVEGVLVFEEYSKEMVEEDLEHIRALRAQDVFVSRRRYRSETLWMRAAVGLQQPRGIFELPTFRYRPRQGQWDHGELFVSFPISYALLLSGVCSGLLINARLRRVPEGGCQSCGYELAGLTGDTCPECGVERG